MPCSERFGDTPRGQVCGLRFPQAPRDLGRRRSGHRASCGEACGADVDSQRRPRGPRSSHGRSRVRDAGAAGTFHVRPTGGLGGRWAGRCRRARQPSGARLARWRSRAERSSASQASPATGRGNVRGLGRPPPGRIGADRAERSGRHAREPYGTDPSRPRVRSRGSAGHGRRRRSSARGQPRPEVLPDTQVLARSGPLLEGGQSLVDRPLGALRHPRRPERHAGQLAVRRESPTSDPCS